MSSRISRERNQELTKHLEVRQSRQYRLDARSALSRNQIDGDSDARLNRRSAKKAGETVEPQARLKDRKFDTLPPELQDLIVQVATAAKAVSAPLAPAQAGVSSSQAASQSQSESQPVTNGAVTPNTPAPVESSAAQARKTNDEALPVQLAPAVAPEQLGAPPVSKSKTPAAPENRPAKSVTAEPPGKTPLPAYQEVPKARSVRLRDLLRKADNGPSTSSPLAAFAKDLAQRGVEREDARRAEAAQIARSMATDPAKTLAAQANHNKSSVQVLLSEGQSVASSVARAPAGPRVTTKDLSLLVGAKPSGA